MRRSFAYWQAERRVFGIVIWGRPDEADVDEICAAHEVGANPLFRGHTSLVDLRALESVDLLAFGRLLTYPKKRTGAVGRAKCAPGVSPGASRGDPSRPDHVPPA